MGGLPATKAIYRQFYLKDDAVVKIASTSYNFCNEFSYGSKTLFYGKATDGLSALSPVGNQWNCFSSAQTTNNCTFLPAGWYTVVSYGTGPDYDNPMSLLNIGGRYNSYVSYKDEFNITITAACPGPRYNRPYKASVNSSNQPHLVQWIDRINSTAAYPRNDTTYVLPTENFNCTLDTPFANHPVKSCSPLANRVAYWVFKTTEVCFLQINTGGFLATVYDKDVRTDSLQFASAIPIQDCNSKAGFIQFCFFQPGTYTLAVFAGNANICTGVSPKIYIDKIGFSRFDYAKNAYDFGEVPPDNTFYKGKPGDINPLNGTRAPSNDFFYCTTGAFPSDPANAVCDAVINPNVYNYSPNKSLYDSAFPATDNIARRNLWYSFVAAYAGNVTVKVENKTLGRNRQPKFAVYRSNVDGSLPFSTVVANGEVDSTIAQGLTYIGTNLIVYPYRCYNTPNNISFYRDPCTSVPSRYYVMVENVNTDQVEQGGQLPNTQVEVSVLIDSVNQVLPNFDHYYQAGDFGNLNAGTFTGPTDNYSCASRDAPDPVYNTYAACSKTIWYKFTTSITGNVRYRIQVNNTISFNYDQVQLFRQSIPGDSTTAGLKIQLFATVGSPSGNWAQTCVAPGTYYLLLPGCSRVNEYVFPEIELIEAVGDFCSRAVPAVIAGPGAVTASVLVNCHTIATDYGEFGPQLTCPPNAPTAQYKSSWFRMDITGSDTLDVTTYLQENTNAASADIKYRLMTGDCSAMQEQSCVLDALTQNTYQCLVPGQSYYVQVFTPLLKNTAQVTGSIDLKLSAVIHSDTCSPLTNCLASANFTTQFDCTTDESVKFINFSTYGTSVSYQWFFGYNVQTSAAVSPSFFYPALPTDQTYTVKLIVTNASCSKVDSVIRTVTVPGRPYVNLGADIAQCNRNAAPVVLRATSHPGATYLWQNNSTADSLVVTASGNNNYWVRVNYNGCSRRDTIRILMSPITERPLQQINLCTDSVLVDVRRGFGETYRWNTGATTRSIYMSTPGYYWADISYFDCVYRDSFEVNNVNIFNPLGNDTTVCLSNGGYILNAATAGAVSYTWQNNSAADSFLVTAAGQYRVSINFGNCIVKDTVNVLGYPAPLTAVTDTSICAGESYFLPWGDEVHTAGSYSDTLQNNSGCDSLIRRINLSIKPAPALGNDTSFCSLQNGYVIDAATTGAVSYTWQDGNSNAVYNVTAAGLYIVQVNFGTCIAVDSVNIQVLSSPTMRITDTSICSGSSFTLPWGLVVQQAGTYTDTLQAAGGCDSLVMQYHITIDSSPSLGNDIAVNICSGNSIDLTAYFNTSGLSGSWTFANNPVLTPVAVNLPGNYTIIAGNAGGCRDTAVVSLTVNNKPQIGNDTSISICTGEIINLNSIYNLTGLNATWTMNTNPVINPAAIITAVIYQLIASNNFACADTAILTLTETPKTFIGNDTGIAVCPGDAVNLLSIYNTNGFNSNWTFNGNIVNTASAVTAAGIYRLIISTAGGCSDTANVSITFKAKPSLGNNTTAAFCEGNTFDLTASYNTTALTTLWSINNNPVTNPAFVNAAGQYQLIATNSGGCTDTALLTLSINPKPALGNDSSIALCQADKLDLTTIYSTGINSNSWTVGNIAVANPASVSTAAVYQLISANAGGCTDTALVTLTINGKPTVVINNPANLCLPQTADLTAAAITAGSTAGITFTYWQDSIFSIAYNKAVMATDGTYYIKGTTGTGCFDIKPVTVKSYPVQMVNAGNDIGICDNDSVATLTVTVTNTTAPVTYRWEPVNAGIIAPSSSSTLVKPSVTPQQYTIITTDGYGCNYSISDTVMVFKQAPVKAFAGNDTIASVGLPHQLNASGGVNFIWSPQQLLNNPFISNPLASIYADSVLLVVEVRDAFGCAGYDTIKIKTYDGITYYVPNAFSPNADNLNDVFRPIPVGIVSTESFRIFNRYGQLLFETSQQMKGWDGTYKGKLQPAANYVWMLKGKGRNGKIIEMKGNVVLVR